MNLAGLGSYVGPLKQMGKSFFSSTGGKFVLGAAGLGLGAGLITGSSSVGYNTFTGAAGGAALGYLKGGMKGAYLGTAAGAAGGGLLGAGGEAVGGGWGGAAVGAVTTSVGASLLTAGMMKHGLFYKPMVMSMKGLAQTVGGKTKDTFKYMRAQGYNPSSPRGFAQNPSTLLESYGNTLEKMTGKRGIINKISDFLGGHPLLEKYFNAAFGSPALIEAGEAAGGIRKASAGSLAKAVGRDVLEGLPLGVGVAGIGAVSSAVFGGGKAKEGRRKTDFGSPWKGLGGAAGQFIRRTIKGVNRAGWKTMKPVAYGAAMVGTPAALMGAAAISFGNQGYGIEPSGWSAPYDEDEGTFMPSGVMGGAPAMNIQHASSLGAARSWDLGADGNLALALHHRRRG